MDSEKIVAEHKNDGDVWNWSLSKLKILTQSKLDQQVVVYHDEGLVKRYKILENFSFDKFLSMVKNGDINVSTKMRDFPKWKDRGMSWRCSPKKTKNLYIQEQK